jgi:hypothetical protein
VHVYVALCDNRHQGIIPVPEQLGDGQSPRTNLYWGALYGVKTFFSRADGWSCVATIESPRERILERCLFQKTDSSVVVVADAYDGREIKTTIRDFVASAAGVSADTIVIGKDTIVCGGESDLAAYVGHNGLMEFALEAYPRGQDTTCLRTIILACASKPYFERAIDSTGACPLLWTTGFMAPEAYTLLAAIESWAGGEPDDTVRVRAAQAYSEYQKCSLSAAKRLLVTGR